MAKGKKGKKKARKVNYKVLEGMWKEENGYKDYYQAQFLRLKTENEELRVKLGARVDTAMMDARIRLASNLGQLVEAVAKAVTMIVGKEVL